MPKKTVGFLGAVLVLPVLPGLAATCDPGYYLANNKCTDCGAKHYCPGDDIRYSCWDLDNDSHLARVYTSVDGEWDSPHATAAKHCICNWDYSDDTRTWYQYERPCIEGPGGIQYHQYIDCRPGYYASHYLWGPWYDQCAPCTNGPAHAHYTSYSTPSSVGAIESNCPWECDDGYGRVGDTCQPLCAAGVTQIHMGTVTAPLYASRHTSPAIVVKIPGGICYGNLTTESGTGIHVRIGNTTYRME